MNTYPVLVEALEAVLLTAKNWAVSCEINGEGINNPAAVAVRNAEKALVLARKEA